MRLESDIAKNVFQSAEEIDKIKRGAWLITFNDLLSLLLTFFILLYALNEHDFKIRNLIETKPINLLNGGEKFNYPSTRATEVDYLYFVMLQKLSKIPELRNKLFLHHKNDKLTISLYNSSLFGNNEDELMLNAEPLIYFLSSSLFELRNKVSISAVDDLYGVNTASGSYKSLLNLRRAKNIAKLLQENSFLTNIQIFLVSNQAEESFINYDKNFDAKQERIDITIYNQERK